MSRQKLPEDPFVPAQPAPNQWLAKLFTEGLGCAPGQVSYAAAEAYVVAHGCSAATLRELATRTLTSPAFASRGYDDPARLLVLWRIARQSEPDPATFSAQLATLRRHRTNWVAMVRAMLGAGFARMVPAMCAGELFGMDAHRAVINVPTAGRGLGDTTSEVLQRRLDAARPGDTVRLKRRSVIRADREIVVPPGVRLETAGSPGPRRYADMARLVRTKADQAPLVGVSAGGRLTHVWIDGQRSNQHIGMDRNSIDVEVLGGSHTAVLDDRITDTAGWSNMVVDQSSPTGQQCHDVAIAGNLIDGYATKFHWYETTGLVDGRIDTGAVTGQLRNLASGQFDISSTFGFADGISNQCYDSHIERNQIVDATDVSIVLFGGAGPRQATHVPHQHSLVEHNTIVNAGNSGWAAMTVDQLYKVGAAKYTDFAGTTIRHNLIWTSPSGFLLIGAGIGTVPWFGVNTTYGYGRIRFVDNTSGSQLVHTQMALEVSRMSGVRVRDNSLRAVLAFADLCPSGPYAGTDDARGSRVAAPHAHVHFSSIPIPSVDRGCLTLHL